LLSRIGNTLSEGTVISLIVLSTRVHNSHGQRALLERLRHAAWLRPTVLPRISHLSAWGLWAGTSVFRDRRPSAAGVPGGVGVMRGWAARRSLGAPPQGGVSREAGSWGQAP